MTRPNATRRPVKRPSHYVDSLRRVDTAWLERMLRMDGLRSSWPAIQAGRAGLRFGFVAGLVFRRSITGPRSMGGRL